MPFLSLRDCAAAITPLLLASACLAQTATPADRPDPLNARAAVAPALHRSALSAYRSAGDVKVGSWKEANDTVRRIGGWRVYAREAAQADAPPAAPPPALVPTPASPPASAPPRPADGRGPRSQP